MLEFTVTYGLQLLVGLVALVALWKDWNEYPKRSPKWGRPIQIGLFVAAVASVGLTMLDTHFNRKGAADQQRLLSDQVRQLRDDARTANDGFRTSFANLYDRFSQLQAKVATDALQKQNTSLLASIEQTKKELKATEAKLSQPKATPVATFQTADAAMIPIRETTLTRSDPVSVPFIIYNPTNVNATNGAINVTICDSCTFASEPTGFLKIPGAPEEQRSMDFQHIYSNSAAQLLTLSLKIPQNLARFEVRVAINCETCTPAAYQHLWVNLN